MDPLGEDLLLGLGVAVHVDVPLPGQGRQAADDHADEQGDKQGAEVDSDEVIAQPGGIDDHVGEAHADGGEARGHQAGLLLRVQPLAELPVGDQHAHGGGADEGGDAVDRRVSGDLEHRPHEGLQKGTHHVHQPVVEQKGQEHAAHRDDPGHAHHHRGDHGAAGGGAHDPLRAGEAGDGGVHGIDQRKDAAHQVQNRVDGGLVAEVFSQRRVLLGDELAVDAEDTGAGNDDGDQPQAHIAQDVDEEIIDVSEGYVAAAVDLDLDEEHEDGESGEDHGLYRADPPGPLGQVQPVHQQDVVEVQGLALLLRQLFIGDGPLLGNGA